MEVRGPALQEAFAAMTPELWVLFPPGPDPGHAATSQPLSTGPWDAMDGLVANMGTSLHDSDDSAQTASRVGAMALPLVPSPAAGTHPHVIAAAPSGLLPNCQQERQQGRKRRKRSLYSRNQLHILESFFHQEKYPNVPQAERLSGMTGLTYQQIRTWFQNRRGKHRRLCTENETPGNCLSTLQTHLYADPRQDPVFLLNWSANPIPPGPDQGMQWTLQGQVNSAFNSRINLPPLQPAPSPTDFQGYNTWAPQTSFETPAAAVQPMTVSTSFVHFSQVSSIESLEVAQLVRAGDSVRSSFSVDNPWNSFCEPNHGAMPALL